MTIFDIETGPIPDDELRQFIPEFVAPPHPGTFDERSVWVGNLKDPVKIREKIEAASVEHANAIAEYESSVAVQQVKHFENYKAEAALSPITGRVLAIGIYPLESEPIVFGDDDEAALLARFWKAWIDSFGEWAGWSIFYFDLPFLIRRSWKHGVGVPEIRISNARYWSPKFIDLAERFALGVFKGTVKLDVAARFLGVGAKNGNGADFAGLWESDRNAAIAYLLNDLMITKGVAERMGMLPVPNDEDVLF